MTDDERARHDVEEALRRSEERLRFVLDRAQVGYWVWDFTERRFELSASCKRLFGLAAGEVVTYERFIAAVHPEDLEPLRQAVRACLAGGGEYDAQFRTFRPDGTVAWVHVKGDASFEGTRATRIAGIVLDVTERRQVQEELEYRERLFRTLVTASTQSVWLYRPGGTLLDQMNDAIRAWWSEFTGQTDADRKAHGGRGWLAVVHPEDRDAAWRNWRRIITEEGEATVEFRVRRWDGVWRWLRLRGMSVPRSARAPPTVPAR